MTIVYHGTTLSGIEPLRAGMSREFPGLYVTDRYEYAARYANARATGTVDPNATALLPCAAVVALDTDDDITWFRRPENHATLDRVETIIKTWRVHTIYICPPDYAPTFIRINGQYMNAIDYIHTLAQSYNVQIVQKEAKS